MLFRSIVFIDLDARGNRSVKTPDRLEALIDSSTPARAGGTKYLFVDEIQNVEGFEDLINGYRTDGGWSIFITGSNSYLLSGELATKLTGRYLGDGYSENACYSERAFSFFFSPSFQEISHLGLSQNREFEDGCLCGGYVRLYR